MEKGGAAASERLTLRGPGRLGETHELTLQVDGDRLIGKVDGAALIKVTDTALDCGAVGLVIEEGRLGVDRVEVGAVA